MSTDSITIPAETARHVLWTFGHDGGYQPGTFSQKLLDLLAYAPPIQTAKLALGFPVEAEAVRLAKYDEDGIAKLKAAAAGVAANEQVQQPTAGSSTLTAPISCKCGNTAGPFDLQGRCETCTESAA